MKKVMNRAAIVSKTKKPRPTTRPERQTISDEEILEIIDLIGSEGISLTEACREKKAVYRTVLKRIRHNEVLGNADARARGLYVKLKVQTMNELVQQTPDVQRARLLCDNIKWEAARVLPKDYGDRMQHTGEGGGPLQVVGIDAAKLAAMSDDELAVLEASLAKLLPAADE